MLSGSGEEQPRERFIIPSRLNQLRMQIEDFVGRDEQVERLARELYARSAEGVTVCFHGPDGFGKTELAYAVALEIAEYCTDGQIVLDLRGHTDSPLSPQRVMQHITNAFERFIVATNNLDLVRNNCHKTLRDKRVVIFLDNVLDAEQVQGLMSVPGCILILASRHPLDLPGAIMEQVQEMTHEEACTMIETVCPGIEDEELVSRLADLCQCIPLALRLCAGLLAYDTERNLEEFLDQYASMQREISENDSLGTLPPAVEAAIRLSYEAMDANEQSTLRQLSVFFGTFDINAAQAIVNIQQNKPPRGLKQSKRGRQKGGTQKMQRGRGPSVPKIFDVMNRLHERQIFKYNDDLYRYEMHEYVRQFAESQMREEEEGAHWRFAMYFGELVSRMEGFSRRDDSSAAEALSWLDCERANIDAGRKWAIDQKNDNLILEYGHMFVSKLMIRYYPRQEQIPWAEISMAAARRLKKRKEEARALTMIGTALHTVGESSRSVEYYRRALDIAMTANDPSLEEAIFSSLESADTLGLGETEHAIENYTRTLKVARIAKDKRGEVAALVGLALTHATQGEMLESISYYTQVLGITREAEDRHGESVALDGLGRVYMDLGKMRQAMELFDESLQIARELGIRDSEASSLSVIGQAHISMGRPDWAIPYFEQALEMNREIGNRSSEGALYNSFARAKVDLGRPEEAFALCEESLAIALEIGNEDDEGTSYGNMAYAHLEKGEPEKAIALAERTLEMKRRLDNDRHIGYSLNFIGVAKMMLGQGEQAIPLQEEALESALKVADRHLEVRIIRDLGRAHVAAGNRPKGIEYLEQAQTIAQEISNRRMEALSSWDLALALYEEHKEHYGDVATRIIELMNMRVQYEQHVGHTGYEEHAAYLAQIQDELAGKV